ncbi:MAG TPA: murein biosynthesis integral membrane protein MurJ [Verrucomicrobiales bacterium]|jgi:putative peptidoglycan lipid II flippase|nr:murein biosynthesis integral membrane protein MurJ [Verrucomicrobiales bacterium]
MSSPLHYFDTPQSPLTPDPPPSSADDDAPASAKTTGIVALAIMCSRVLGLIREIIFAALFKGFTRDCFIAAFRIPNLLRDLFAEGALSTAFVTVFSQKLKKDGDQAAWLLAHRVLSLTTVFMSAVCLLGIIFSRQIVSVLCGDWNAEKQEFTTRLTQIMFPFILMVSLAALVMGILNAKKVFGAPAMASSFFNIFSIAGGCLLAWLMGPNDQWAMIGFSIGTLTGGMAQLAVQFPALRRIGYAFRFDRHWKDPDVRRILLLMVPSIIAGSSVQINVFLNTIFVAKLEQQDGPMSWLNVAFRLMQLPLGVFGVAVATVTLPVLSRVALEGMTPKVREVLGTGTRLVVFLTLPCAVGLFVLAHPIIAVLYEHGKFLPHETAGAAGALRWYSVGLVFYACLKVVQPAFTAIGRNRIPMYVAFLSIAVNAGLNYYFVVHLHKDHTWLALTTAVVACLNFVLLYSILTKIAGGLENHKLLDSLMRQQAPVIVLGVIAWLGWHYVLEPRWWYSGLFARCTMLGLTITAAGTAFVVVSHLAKVEEARQFMDIAQRRLSRKRSKAPRGSGPA